MRCVPIKFKIDENLPVDVSTLLNQAGYGTHTVYDEELAGEADSELIEICRQEQRTLITLDTDFCDIRTYPPKYFSGIIVLRVKQQDKFYILDTIQKLTPNLLLYPLEQHLWIVDERHIRIRG